MVSPVVLAGVLVAHALAYRLTATPTDRFHAYLAHAPQVLVVLALSGAALSGFGRSRAVPPAHIFPLVAVTTFLIQEHLERVVHEGSFPVLAGSPAFVVGLLLQIPVALVAWLLARRLLTAVADVPARRLAMRPRFDLPLVGMPPSALGSVEPPGVLGRGPPSLLRSR